MKRLVALGLLLAAPLLAAPVFEADFEAATGSPPAGFAMWGSEQWKVPANYTRDTTNPHGGQACFRLHHPAQTAGYVVSAPDRAVRPRLGQSYTVTFWARSDRPGECRFGWTAYASVNPFRDAGSPGGVTFKVGPEWRQVTYTIREGTSFFASQAPYLLLTFYPAQSAAEERTLWLDDVVVDETPNPDSFRLPDPSSLKVAPRSEPLRPGRELAVTVDVGRRSQATTLTAGGISFHRVVGWTGQPFDKAGRETLDPRVKAAIKDLRLPMTRFYAVGDEPFGLEASLDKLAGLCREVAIPLEWVVVELEDQSANRAVAPADWARAVAYARSKGYHFRFWEVANEPYSSTWGGKYGQAFPTAEAYADHVKQVSAAVKAVDPAALIGCAIGDGLPWCNGVLARAAGSYDFVVPHYYAGFGRVGEQTFEAVTIGHNQRTLDRARQVEALIQATNPGRQVSQLDTEWGESMSGPKGEEADYVARNANAYGLLHRAVRLVYYARDGLLRGASSWQMLSHPRGPGFGVLTQNKPDQAYLIYWLYHTFNRHVLPQVASVSGTAPWYTPKPADDRSLTAAHDGPLTPLLATTTAAGDRVELMIPNGSATLNYPATITLRGLAPRQVEGLLLQPKEVDGDPLVAKPEDIFSKLPVTVDGDRLRFTLPPHGVAWISVK